MTMQRGIYLERQKNDLMGIKVNKLERQNVNVWYCSYQMHLTGIFQTCVVWDEPERATVMSDVQCRNELRIRTKTKMKRS